MQATRLQRTQSGRYALFVIYAWNYEVLLTAVRSYVAAGFGKSLIILDNTSNSTLLADPVIAELVAEVIPTRTRLTFSQAQNFMAGGPSRPQHNLLSSHTFPSLCEWLIYMEASQYTSLLKQCSSMKLTKILLMQMWPLKEAMNTIFGDTQMRRSLPGMSQPHLRMMSLPVWSHPSRPDPSGASSTSPTTGFQPSGRTLLGRWVKRTYSMYTLTRCSTAMRHKESSQK